MTSPQQRGHLCKKCGIKLIVNVNWTNGCMKKHDYICRGCKKIYNQKYRNKNIDACKLNGKKYYEANKEKCIEKSRQNHKENRSERNKSCKAYYIAHRTTSMSENKNCSLYLGVHISEQILRHVFTDVKVMPACNKGFDFICNHGKKIDVKSSCIQTWDGCKGRWAFTISRNKIPDYFLCLAFDNRTDLTPLHIWLLPAEKFNHMANASIAISNVHRWDRYKLDIEKVVEQCIKFGEEINE